MDYFEGLVKTLLEYEGYWVRQSFKVELTKQEKRDIGKHSIPRPEIDLLALNHKENRIFALEVKSFLDSGGVRIDELLLEHEIPTGRYKLFTCSNFRNIVMARLKQDLIKQGMANEETIIALGLAAGKVYQARTNDLKNLFLSRGWFFWSPEDIREKVSSLAEKDYENEPSIITAKILMRSPIVNSANGMERPLLEIETEPVNFISDLEIGRENINGQVLIEKSDKKSTTHPYAKIWAMRCKVCGYEYGSNSCDAHIRRCPKCNPDSASGEPL